MTENDNETKPKETEASLRRAVQNHPDVGSIRVTLHGKGGATPAMQDVLATARDIIRIHQAIEEHIRAEDPERWAGVGPITWRITELGVIDEEKTPKGKPPA